MISKAAHGVCLRRSFRRHFRHFYTSSSTTHRARSWPFADNALCQGRRRRYGRYGDGRTNNPTDNVWPNYQISYFKVIMHQIRFRLGLRTRPCWGSSQHSPKPPSWVLGVLPLRGGRGGKGREGKGKGAEAPQLTFLAMPLRNGRSNLKIATTCLLIVRSCRSFYRLCTSWSVNKVPLYFRL